MFFSDPIHFTTPSSLHTPKHTRPHSWLLSNTLSLNFHPETKDEVGERRRPALQPPKRLLRRKRKELLDCRCCLPLPSLKKKDYVDIQAHPDSFFSYPALHRDQTLIFHFPKTINIRQSFSSSCFWDNYRENDFELTRLL